ncbi:MULTISPECIES: hypothetical protein [unclassified Streptomyces]
MQTTLTVTFWQTFFALLFLAMVLLFVLTLAAEVFYDLTHRHPRSR